MGHDTRNAMVEFQTVSSNNKIKHVPRKTISVIFSFVYFQILESSLYFPSGSVIAFSHNQASRSMKN